MEMWRRVWRDGLTARLSARALAALRAALLADDPRLVQGTTCSPPALQALCERRVETACALGYCGWQGEGLESVAEVEEYCATPPTSGWPSGRSAAFSLTGTTIRRATRCAASCSPRSSGRSAGA